VQKVLDTFSGGVARDLRNGRYDLAGVDDVQARATDGEQGGVFDERAADRRRERR
jgi:hypothetical protein